MNPSGVPWPQMLVDNIVIDLVGHESVMSLITDSLSASDPLVVVSANLDHIHHFARDESWARRTPAESVHAPAEGLRWLTLLDGVPLVRTANLVSGRRWPKLSGSDLIDPILEAAVLRGARVGFLGGAAETHRQLVQTLGTRFPALCIAGTWAPTRAEVSDPEASANIAAEIRAANVDILVVALGKPRQEEWIARFGQATGARVLLAFGAVVDFLAGRVRRAPEWVAAAGAEWAWRLSLEPRRLGRRYLLHGPPALLELGRNARVIEAAIPHPREGAGGGQFVAGAARVDVAVVVVTYNSASDIPALISDLRLAARDRPIRLIVVDNQSSDDTLHILRTHDDIVVVESGGNVGYGAGMNAGLRAIGNADAVLMLNPDLALAPGAVTRLLTAAAADRVGAVVPLIVDADGSIFPSLRREPTISRAIGDALLGSKIRSRPGSSSEIDSRPGSYLEAHDVDWATGAALLVPATVARQVGDWYEQFFLFSEETDYFRRIREIGHRVRFEPSAVVVHRGGGSGTASPTLATLMAVNRIRYVERYHGPAYSTLFRAAVALAEGLRSYDAVHRRTLAVVLNRRSWQALPQATKPAPALQLSGPRHRGAVIVPAYNEAAVIERTLGPLSRAAVDGFIELIVVCNGCTDDTAHVARSVPGVRVLELRQGSKPAALNAGDDAATMWPRLYLDADVQISANAVLEVLDRLGEDDILVARPTSRYDVDGASAMVRSYYRARSRIPQHKLAIWGAGAYGLSSNGHERFGRFPTIMGDDLYVDTQFGAHEKVVVTTEPSIVKTPADTKSLLAILRRGNQAGAELAAGDTGRNTRIRSTSRDTAIAVVRTIRGLRSAVDAAAYLMMAIGGRWRYGNAHVWERDESSRRRE